VRTAAAGRPFPGGRRFEKLFSRHRLLHLIKDPAIGCHNKLLLRQCFCGSDQLAGGTYCVSHIHNRLWRFRMHQNRSLRIKSLHAGQRLGFEFIVHDAGTLPAEYISPGLFLDIISQVSVRCPDDLLPQTIQMFNQLDGDTGGHNPVCTRFNRGRSIGVNHHGSVRMRIAKGVELINWAAQIK
jgi:hypothetical protein